MKASAKNGYLLMIEDEPLIQQNNKKALERDGYTVRQAYTLSEARAMIDEETPRAISLDIKMPDGCGLDFLRELRKTSNVPVLILSSKGMPQDIIKGFEAGGDDYVSKPYALPIFMIRLTALMRLASLVPEKIEIGPLSIDMTSNRAYLDSVDMGLQQKELSLLQLFMQCPGQILSPEHLYERVWGEKMFGGGNALKVSISKLRTKLAGSGYTVTVSRGEGYYFEEE